MKSKIRVVVDTNIFIDSWFRDKLNEDMVLNLIDNQQVRLYCSQDTIGELMYITKKFANSNIDNVSVRQIIMNKVAEFFLLAHSVNTRTTQCPNLKDPYDEMFVKSAIQGEVDYLITNDFKSGMHNLATYEFKVVTAKQFLDDFEGLQVAVGDSD